MNLEYLVQNIALSRPRREMLNGREHLVAPMTMIVPGVLPGSKGALLYPADEVGKDPTPWNGVPITLRHPVRNGKNVSARDSDVLDKQGIGVVRRAKTGDRLRAEAWIDVDKANRLDPRIVRNIEKGIPLEVSTGLYTDNYPAQNGARHNGRPYQWVARNYRPDHLAILPDEKGACSVDDGCGILMNSNRSCCGTDSNKLCSNCANERRVTNMSKATDNALSLVEEAYAASKRAIGSKDRSQLERAAELLHLAKAALGAVQQELSNAEIDAGYGEGNSSFVPNRRMSRYENEPDTDAAEIMANMNPMSILTNERRREIASGRFEGGSGSSYSDDDVDVAQMAPSTTDWRALAQRNASN